MDPRLKKQLIIATVILLVAGAAVWGIVDYAFIVEATCTDGIQNGREEGVDCGLIACGVECEPALSPIQVVFEKLLEVRPGDYDFVAQVSNPNSNYGSSRVNYQLTLHRPDGSTGVRGGSFYILPGQIRHLIVQGISETPGATRAELEVVSVEWERLNFFDPISFPVQRRSYVVVNEPNRYSEFEAIIFNATDYDFDRVEVGVILFDGAGNIVGVGRTDIRTFLSRTERHAPLTWPAPFTGEVARQDVEVLTNVFENLNFIRTHGTQDRFQQFF